MTPQRIRFAWLARRSSAPAASRCYWLSAAVLMLAAGAAGVASGAAPPPPPPLRQKPPAPPAVAAARPQAKAAPQGSHAAGANTQSDAALERAIRGRFSRSKIRADGFTVSVAGGVATIEGKTKVIQRKGTATRLAKLAGANSVVNRIEVDEAALDQAAANLSKGRRRRAELARSEARSQPVAPIK